MSRKIKARKRNYKVIDYTKPYKPKKESLIFFSWVNLYLPPEGEETPKFHYIAIDLILSRHQFVQVLMFRGAAKSTLTTKFLPLSVAFSGKLPNFGRVVNVAIFSATYDQAVGLLSDVIAAWLSSPKLEHSIKLALDKAGKPVANRANHICFSTLDGKWVHIQAFSADGQIRGTKQPDENGKSHRLELIILDDILKDSVLESEKEREKVAKWYKSSLKPAVNTKNYKIVAVGTPMTEDDLLNGFKKGKSYKTLVAPIAQDFPVPRRMLISAWPSLFTPKEIIKTHKAELELGDDSAFYRERMLKIVNDSMRIIKEGWIREYKHVNYSMMNIYTSIDMAVSKETTADASSVITIGVDSLNRKYVLEVDFGILDPSELIDTLFRHVRKYKPVETRAEKAALQLTLNHFVNKKMDREKTYFLLEALTNNSKDSKHKRIMGLVPEFKRGLWYLPEVQSEGVVELKAELLGYLKTGPTTRYVDALDCLANFLDTDFIYTPSDNYVEDDYDDDEIQF